MNAIRKHRLRVGQHPRLAIWRWLALLAVVSAPPAFAQQSPPQEAQEETQDAPITARQATTDDAEIAARIRSIFDEINGLSGIDVRVSAGVVNLTGSVPSAEHAQRASAIAARVSGVVTVEEDLARDLDLDSNLAPALTQFRDDLRDLARGLPLLGVALAIGIVIVLIGYLLAARQKLWRLITPNAFMAELAATSVRFLFIIFGLVVALEVLGATALLGAVLGGAGVIGIALGFAVRDTVDNYVSSLMLSLRQPFRANDHVVIDANEGRVIRLTSRATILMTLDGNHLRIPNSKVFKAVILNFTRNPERRFEFELGIDANDDPVEGMRVGLEAMESLAFVLHSPVASAVIQNVGDSNIVLRYFGWVDQTHTDFLKGRSLAIQAAKSALEAAGFALPEPIYRLRFDEPPPFAAREGVATPTRSRVARQPASHGEHDVAPDTQIAKLVQEERSDAQKDDLLDSQRPIE